MTFWQTFDNVYRQIWDILDTQMTFGAVSFSFLDVLIGGTVFCIGGFLVHLMVYDERW